MEGREGLLTTSKTKSSTYFEIKGNCLPKHTGENKLITMYRISLSEVPADLDGQVEESLQFGDLLIGGEPGISHSLAEFPLPWISGSSHIRSSTKLWEMPLCPPLGKLGISILYTYLCKSPKSKHITDIYFEGMFGLMLLYPPD